MTNDNKPKRKLNIKDLEIRELDRETMEKLKGGKVEAGWSRSGNHGSVGVDR
ncbi:hypothetical protein DB30_04622 [Enhygromyxa salina]|uniref:Uncharacterized protein n=1 Tax=Enhygromyxa salina TaxID=215803 RepID=A0A0C2DHI0_9BACT|nr:hypothetical protein [Enhygromyxa salina]KIG19157.1 hypothetical protein DB30_04622 [Enhygromyxa salina]